MAVCETVQRKVVKVCSGDMRNRIDIYIRRIVAPEGFSPDFEEDFITPKTVWAMVQTAPPGEALFDGTNTSTAVTHYFYIRYLPNVTFEDWILYKNKYYDILHVENLNEQDDFLLLRANLRGTADKPVNFA
jgi:head-tail adaptor